MPRQHTITLYKFEELSEEAQKRALDRHREINVDGFDWWDPVYEDAENVHIKIKKFDIDNGTISLHYMEGWEDVAKAVTAQHGDNCASKHAAVRYLLESRPTDPYGPPEEIFDEAMESYYLRMLEEEYDHLTSDDEIMETFDRMEYEFKENGEVF